MTITPQFSDVDSFQHINHLAILRWFEAARMPICRLFAPDNNVARMRLIMVRVEADYLAEMFLGNDVEIRTRVAKIGNTSFHIAQEAYQNGKQTVRGTVVLVHFDHETKKTIPFTPEFRKTLEETSDK
ncbi:MAG: acyl-CoA thioesterase [Planctomycetaceae bacterium]|nr:acyl-CoA thioesterase [Planctomycetaceae bacterium]